MRKLIIFILTVVALAAFPSQRASAQYFDHLALGISAGVDGFGLQLAAPIGNQFQMRAGYACLPPMWKPHAVINLEETKNQVMMQKTVGDGRREEGHFVEPTAVASRSHRAW